MKVDVNFWAVLLAAVASMVVGMLYYADEVLGKEWKKLAKIDSKRFEKERPKVVPAVFVASFITAYVLAYVTFLYHNFFQDSWMAAGALTAVILWLGISATTIFVHGAFEQRPRTLLVISLGNRLLTLLAMGLVIGWLHP